MLKSLRSIILFVITATIFSSEIEFNTMKIAFENFTLPIIIARIFIIYYLDHKMIS